MNNITENKFFIPGFAVVVTLIVVLILVVFRGGVPDDAVAVVDGEKVAKSDFNKILNIYASQSQQTTGKDKSKPVPPDPPTFSKCIANKKKSSSKKSKDSELKKQCQEEWESAREQIMTALVQAKWYENEAADRGIKVTDAEVKQRFVPLKQQTFPKEQDYKKFLKDTGQSEADLLKLVRNEMYKEKIRNQVTKSKPATDKEISEHYNKNKKDFITPASRNLLIVYTNKKSKADKAAAEIKGGTPWAKVAGKYSEDSSSKANGGKFDGVTEGQFEPKLNKAVFSAKKGETVGPIKTSLGYYVFRVTKVSAKKQQSLKEASETIKQTIKSERETKANDTFSKEFEEKWRGKTKCADLYKVSGLCDNAPKPKPTGETGAAAGN